MSLHAVHIPSARTRRARQHADAEGARPVALVLRSSALVFVIGFSSTDRAWRAYHVNWLFFTVHLVRRRDVRRRAAHHDGALVAPDHPVLRRATSRSCPSRS